VLNNSITVIIIGDSCMIMIMVMLLCALRNYHSVHYNLPWYFTACEYVNRIQGRQVCGILLGVGKGANVLIKQVSPLVDSEVVACQFMFFNVFWVIV